MRNFEGSFDKSAVVLEGVFPNSGLVVSSPLEFSGKRSGVYVEGDFRQLEIVFDRLTKLVKVPIDDRLFGRWIAVTPPEEEVPRTIIHYEAAADFEKVYLLNLVFREQIAKICDFFLSPISTLLVRFNGEEIYRCWTALPRDFVNGSFKFPPAETEPPERRTLN